MSGCVCIEKMERRIECFLSFSPRSAIGIPNVLVSLVLSWESATELSIASAGFSRSLAEVRLKKKFHCHCSLLLSWSTTAIAFALGKLRTHSINCTIVFLLLRLNVLEDRERTLRDAD